MFPLPAFLAIAWAISLAVVGWKAYDLGGDHQIAKQTQIKEAIDNAKEEARKGAAEAISQIEIKQVTIQGELRREIRTNTIYADCKHSPDGLRLLNSAITNTVSAQPGSGGQLSAASAPSR